MSETFSLDWTGGSVTALQALAENSRQHCSELDRQINKLKEKRDFYVSLTNRITNLLNVMPEVKK